MSVSLQDSAKIFFLHTYMIDRTIITLDCVFDDEQYLTRCSKLLCTMLFMDVVKSMYKGNEVTLDVNMIS